MKEKLEQIKEKALEIYKKIGKKTVIIAASGLVIAVAVVLNFILWGAADESENKPAVDLSDLSAVEPVEGEETQSAEGDAYFAQMALSRTQARDEAIEVLNGVINSDTAVDEMKTEAQAELGRIAKDMEDEANIESLVKSKGFAECVAVISGDTANVIVKSDGITQAQVSQISEIVYEQAGIIPANLKIVEN